MAMEALSSSEQLWGFSVPSWVAMPSGHGSRDLLVIAASITCFVVLAFVHGLWKRMKPRIYLVDYSCAKSPDGNKATAEAFMFYLMRVDSMRNRDKVFQGKVFLKSGIGEEAYVPLEVLEKRPLADLQRVAEDQIHLLVVGSVDLVLKKTGVSPQEIDILVVYSSAFNPTPSLTSFLVNHFKLRADVKTFYLSGMGCSAGLIALKLAADLLRVHQRATHYAVVAGTELLLGPYDGKERSMMVANCIFRSAGNALLLSNRRDDKSTAKMEVIRVVRVNRARHDEAHHVVEVLEDEEGKWGPRLSPQLVEVASKTMTENFRTLAPLVLPVGELCKAVWAEVQRRVLKREGMGPFVPNFKKAFQHICIHPGGKTVIEGVGKGLGLSKYDVEPSAMALHRFGNTSASGVWYTLAYMEAKKRLKKGDRVLQIGLGSGFKCVTSVLRVLKDLDELPRDSPWAECVHRYPVYEELHQLPHLAPIFQSFAKLLGSDDGVKR